MPTPHTVLICTVLVLLISGGAEIMAEDNTPEAEPTAPQSAQQTSDPQVSPKKSSKKPDNKRKTKPDKNGSASPQQAPKPAPVPTPTNALTPHSVLGLTNWKLTLPIDTAHAGNPDEIKQPELKTYSINPYFMLNGAKSGVIFRAHVGGETTNSSGYPRSELREMTNGGSSHASWSNTSGTHTLSVTHAITHTPSVKPHVVVAQVHDGSDDVIAIRLEGTRLIVDADGDEIGILNGTYALGTSFNTRIVAANGTFKVYYNDILKVAYRKSRSGLYFKTGMYTQSNPSKGDSPSNYGEAIIYAVSVAHS